jgi:hypothetical protein
MRIDDFLLTKRHNYWSPFDGFGKYLVSAVVQYIDFFNRSSIDLDDILVQFVHNAHVSCVEEDTLFFYDAHKHETESHNHHIQLSNIIPKITTKIDIIFHILMLFIFGSQLSQPNNQQGG